jgi:hypothetical protein
MSARRKTRYAPALAHWRSWSVEQLERWRATLRVGRLPTHRALPVVTVTIGPWAPAVALRLVQAGVALGCVALKPPGSGVWTLAALGALLLVLRPSGIVAACFTFALGFRLAVSPSGPWLPQAFVLLLGLHLLVELGRLVAGVPWNARVQLRVLLPAARRFLPVQALAQLLALVGAVLTSTGVTVPWVPVLVGVALTGLAWLLLSRLTGSDRRG